MWTAQHTSAPELMMKFIGGIVTADTETPVFAAREDREPTAPAFLMVSSKRPEPVQFVAFLTAIPAGSG